MYNSINEVSMNNKQIETLLSKNLPFWKDLSDQDKISLIENTYQQIYKKGDLVHGGKSICTGMLYIIEGDLRGYVLSDDGKEVNVNKLNKENICILSASCVMGSLFKDFYLEATTDTSLINIDVNYLQLLAEKYPAVKIYVYEVSSSRYTKVLKKMQDILFLSVEKRLAIKLLDEYNSQNKTILKITHDDIAKDIGSVREVVSRSLKQLQKHEIVKLSRATVELIDIEKIKSIAQ